MAVTNVWKVMAAMIEGPSEDVTPCVHCTVLVDRTSVLYVSEITALIQGETASIPKVTDRETALCRLLCH